MSPECAERFREWTTPSRTPTFDDESVIASAEAHFQSEDEQQTIGSIVYVFESDRESSGMATGFEEIYDKCGDDLARSLEQQLTEAPVVVQDERVIVSNIRTSEELSTPNLGDWSREWKFTAAYDLSSNEPPLALLGDISVESAMSITFIRIGAMAGQFLRTDVAVGYAAPDVAPPAVPGRLDAAATDALRDIFVERMQEAPASRSTSDD
jgi:hypothetical protein